jgi:hypothetical protein
MPRLDCLISWNEGSPNYSWTSGVQVPGLGYSWWAASAISISIFFPYNVLLHISAVGVGEGARGAYRVLVRKPQGRRRLWRPRRIWEDRIKMDLQKCEMVAWSGLICLRIRTDGGLLWMRQWTFGFHKMRGISWLAENHLASQEGMCPMGLFG